MTTNKELWTLGQIVYVGDQPCEVVRAVYPGRCAGIGTSCYPYEIGVDRGYTCNLAGSFTRACNPSGLSGEPHVWLKKTELNGVAL